MFAQLQPQILHFSRLRFAKERLPFRKHHSIGFKSGLRGGRLIAFAPTRSIATLRELKLSMTTTSPLLRPPLCANSSCPSPRRRLREASATTPVSPAPKIFCRRVAPSIAPSTTSGAVKPPSQRRQKSRRLPMTMRHEINDSFADLRTTMRRRHPSKFVPANPSNQPVPRVPP